jgi:hypothetical protein
MHARMMQHHCKEIHEDGIEHLSKACVSTNRPVENEAFERVEGSDARLQVLASLEAALRIKAAYVDVP